jgi:membrane protease YdiL (CAAX protease family)
MTDAHDVTPGRAGRDALRLALVGFAAWLGGQFVGAAIVQALGYPSTPLPVGPLLALGGGASALAVFATAWATQGRSLRLAAHRWWYGAVGFAVVFPLWSLAVATLYQPMLTALGAEFASQSHLDWFRDPQGMPLLVNAFVVALFVPIAEEVLFRGWIQRGFEHAFGRWPALWFTAFAFALVHHPWQVMPPLLLLGLFFGWLRLVTGGLAAPIVAHVLQNGVTLAIVLFAPGWTEQPGSG